MALQQTPMGSQNSRIIPEGENSNEVQTHSSCCVRPSPDEVKEWSTNFDALLKHEYGVHTFHEFLKTQHSQENLNFWMAVERYKQKSPEVKQHEAKFIYENYISIMSPTEISIDSKTRNAIEVNMENPSSDTFQPAQEQIYILMKRDCLPRFLKSKMYKQLRSGR